ncbi:hypothetical protein ACFL3T_01710 [Patescibacteria group bacterium]
MSSLSETDKDRILKFLDKLSKDIAVIHRKRVKGKGNIKLLKDNAKLSKHYRKFTSPRKVGGKLIDKAKNKFYYETEYFIGEIVQRQEKFNEETIKYIEKLEKEIKKLSEK